jgi:hypothetical protein
MSNEDETQFRLLSQSNITDLYREINEYNKGYQHGSKLVKDENCDLLAYSHNIFNMWKKYFSPLLNLHRCSDVRQIEIQRTDALLTHRGSGK